MSPARLAVSVYFTQGSSPLHSDDDSEEIIYVRRGTGYVQIDEREGA